MLHLPPPLVFVLLAKEWAGAFALEKFAIFKESGALLELLLKGLIFCTL